MTLRKQQVTDAEVEESKHDVRNLNPVASKRLKCSKTRNSVTPRSLKVSSLMSKSKFLGLQLAPRTEVCYNHRRNSSVRTMENFATFPKNFRELRVNFIRITMIDRGGARAFHGHIGQRAKNVRSHSTCPPISILFLPSATAKKIKIKSKHDTVEYWKKNENWRPV